MVPTIEANGTRRHTVEEFYDRLAPDYDAMTTFEKRFIQEEPFFRLLVRRYRIASAVDAGCGTGFHTILLARLGVRVTAVDISARMLDELARHTAGLGLDIRTARAPLIGLSTAVGGSSDALFCMGNTLAHLLTQEELRTVLEEFARALAPEGILFIQLLNYDRILGTRPAIQSIKETEQGTFIRSYEYTGETIQFTIRKNSSGQGGKEQIHSVTLRPVLSAELTSLLEATGFSEVHTFGSAAMEAYDPMTSKDLVVLARRTGS
ncbi:MAG TPA: methyltransferase domain-containing protein [Bacteroidota bacterium]|nr:methyltransferase domain-containing protein [Bacteroidota bacterium]